MTGLELELQVMGKGQIVLTASYRDILTHVQVPKYSSNYG